MKLLVPHPSLAAQGCGIPRPRRRLQRGRGLSLIEAAVSLGIMALMTAYVVEKQAQSQRVIHNNTVAERMATVVSAAATYVHANYNLLSQDPANGGIYQSGGLAIPIFDSSGAVPGGLPTVQGAGLLPTGFAATNAYGQREWLLAVRRSTSPLKMDFMVITEGGRSIDNGDLPWIAAKVGAAGGFVSSMAPYSSDTVWGAYGGWGYGISNWSVGSHVPAVGHLAATLAFTESPVADYLYRVAVPGHPEANAMYADLNLSGGGVRHNITGVGNVDTQTLTASGSISASHVNTQSLTASGSISATNVDTQTLTASGSISTGSIKLGSEIIDVADARMINELYNLNCSPNQAVNMMSGTPKCVDATPSGAIVAFPGSCPSGWTVYSAAAGRFLVGAGASVDYNGNYSSYSVGQTGGENRHRLSIDETPLINAGIDTTPGSYSVARVGYYYAPWSLNMAPSYVAVTWCQKN